MQTLSPRPRPREKVLAMIEETGVIPVVRVAGPEQAFCAVEASMRAGISVAEITLTTPKALDIIAQLAERYKDELLVGAGTVLDPESCRAAILAGAEFIVSPSVNPRMIEMARRYGKICMPGALTPTEVLTAWEAGADLVKVFPCGLVGGPRYIRQLRGPFPQIRFVPSQGVEVENVAEFIAAGAVAVGVGEEIFDPAAVQQGDLDRVSANARRYVEAIRSARAQSSAKRA